MLCSPNKEALQFLMDVSDVFAEIEENGIPTDLRYIIRKARAMRQEKKDLQNDFDNSDIGVKWRETYKENLNYNSTQQLGKVLFEELDFTPKVFTPTGKPATSKDTLLELGDENLKKFFKAKEIDKAIGTYLLNYKKETVKGVLHPNFNLNTVKTYRTSSSAPNFQNVPKHDPYIKTLVRDAFRAPKDHYFVEIDYGSMEVRCAACYHKDPRMVRYIETGYDPHREMAAKCYLCELEQVSKDMRQAAKNRFVFPTFYGSWWRDTGENMWEGISELKLALKDGTPLEKHLNEQGILNLGKIKQVGGKYTIEGENTFFHHIKAVEDWVWDEMFPVYAQWRRDWVKEYKRKGYFTGFTGFNYQGVMKRTDVINYAVQGVGAHCLLWSLMRMQEHIKRNQMVSKLVGQIHDSIVALVHKDELERFKRMARRVMTIDIRKEWEWIIVPLEIEMEISKLGGTWAEMEEVEI